MELLNNERIIEEIKPIEAMKTYWRINALCGVVITSVILAIVVIVPFIFAKEAYAVMWIMLGGLFLLLLYSTIKAFIITHLKYKKLKYWITNKRIIIRRGLIGQSEKSILLERIGEITVRHTWFQSLFGIKVVRIEVLGTGKRREVMVGIPNTDQVKQLILELLSQKRAKEKLTY